MNNCFKKSSYFVYGVRASKLTPTLSGSDIVYAVGTDSWVQLSFSQFQVSQKIDFKTIWTHESSPTAWESNKTQISQIFIYENYQGFQ